jgi:aminoglycoside phosphotransferase (APT) family kinase protein
MSVPYTSALDVESLIDAAEAEGGPWDLSKVIVYDDDSGFVTVESADGWMLRFPLDDEAGFALETDLIRLLQGRLPTPIPVIEQVGTEVTFSAYRKLTGVAFDPAGYAQATEFQRETLAQSLAGFLAALHDSITPAEAETLGIPALDSRTELDLIAAELDWLPRAKRRHVDGLIGRFAHMWVAGRPEEPKVLLHNDFHFGNLVFAEPIGLLTGVWGFAGAQLGPPAFDLRYLDDAPGDLLERTAGHYQMLTTRPIDLEAVQVANRIEDLYDVLQSRDLERFDELCEWLSQ